MDRGSYSREQNEICRQAAFHCAQVLAGVKASNILIITEGTEEDVALVLSGTGVAVSYTHLTLPTNSRV